MSHPVYIGTTLYISDTPIGIKVLKLPTVTNVTLNSIQSHMRSCTYIDDRIRSLRSCRIARFSTYRIESVWKISRELAITLITRNEAVAASMTRRLREFIMKEHGAKGRKRGREKERERRREDRRENEQPDGRAAGGRILIS